MIKLKLIKLAFGFRGLTIPNVDSNVIFMINKINYLSIGEVNVIWF